jgi:hypothetical protein
VASHRRRRKNPPTPTPPRNGEGSRQGATRAASLFNPNIYSSNIQVSLVPPPWLEFTTSEPSFSATRVKPPGTMVT